MSATTKTSILQRLASAWESDDEPQDAADMGTAFGLDCSLAALEDEGRESDALAAAASCWPDAAAPRR